MLSWSPPSSFWSIYRGRVVYRRSVLPIIPSSSKPTFITLDRPQPAEHPALTREQRKELVRRCTDPLCSEDVHAPSAWFNFVPPSLVNRDNFMEWLYWAIFSSTVEDGEEFLSEAEEYLIEIEQRSGVRHIPGHNPKIKPIRVTLDPVRTTHRPLIWYLVCTSLSEVATNGVFLTIRLEACRLDRHRLSPRSLSAWFQTSHLRRHPLYLPPTTVHYVFPFFSRSSAILVPPTPFGDEAAHFIPTRHRGTVFRYLCNLFDD